MSIYLNGPEANTVVGLGTFTHIAAKTVPYTFKITTAIHEASSVIIVINQNGSPIATSSAPTQGQQTITLQADVQVTTGDTITFVLTSAAAIDNQLNNVKSIISISPGL